MNLKPKMLFGQHVDQAEICDLEGSLSEAIGIFKDWQRRHDGHGSQWSDLRITLTGSDHEGPSTIELRGDRLETTEEFTRRNTAHVATQKRRRKRAALSAGQGQKP